ncbi:ABC transporter permease [uncultured Vagococcus sp.]|uniref:ABC transporter permease n=1 Tax=uncultured Vagococcus sp. TaxID=189676 RepID=UPI0028D89900|nr:ABC transporter permease [uncultured Vagococcus sp.]
MSPLFKRICGSLLALVVVHLIWLLASLGVNKAILPSPVVVYQSFGTLVKAQLGWHIMVSLRRIFIGMGVALVIGSGLGVLMGRSKLWNNLLDPLIYLTYPIPKLALLPMIMLLFGLGELSKIILISLIVFPQVVLSVRDAVQAIPEHLYDIYQCMQASSWQRFKAITLPASFSAVLSTSRISLGTAISVLFFTENYGTKYGMGYFIMDAWTRMDYPMMYGGILVLSGIGFSLFILIDLLGMTMSWQKKKLDA